MGYIVTRFHCISTFYSITAYCSSGYFHGGFIFVYGKCTKLRIQRKSISSTIPNRVELLGVTGMRSVSFNKGLCCLGVGGGVGTANILY